MCEVPLSWYSPQLYNFVPSFPISWPSEDNFGIPMQGEKEIEVGVE